MPYTTFDNISVKTLMSLELSASDKLATFNLTLEQATSWVLANVDNASLIYTTCQEFGITSRMLAEIVSPVISNATESLVDDFFAANNLDGEALHLDDSPEQYSGSYPFSEQHAFDDGYNNGYFQGYYERFLTNLGWESDSISVIFSSDTLQELHPSLYYDGFTAGASAWHNPEFDADYTRYFLSSPNDPAESESVTVAALGEANGYIDGYKDGLVEFINRSFFGGGLQVEGNHYSPESVAEYDSAYAGGYSSGRSDGSVLASFDHFVPTYEQVSQFEYLFN